MVSLPLFSFLGVLLWALQLCNALSSIPPKKPQGPILVVGAGGGTGLRALSGLLDVGYSPEQIRVLSRNVDKPSMTALRDMGFVTVQGDLDNPSSSALLEDATRGCVGCYIHSTSSDTKKLDTGELDRARNLARAINAQGDIRHVVYNSSAGEKDHGNDRIAQKHDVENLFLKEFDNIPFTSLRANLFMEELWKSYTRPSILKGKFPFSVPSNRKIYLTSVRDMGRLAGCCFMSPDTTTDRIINVAGDVLTAQQIADTFATAQGSPCAHTKNRLLAFLSRLFFRDLYQVISFYRRSTETTNVEALKEEFPGLLTPFATFLDETDWSNSELTFEDFKIVRDNNISQL